MEKPTTTTVTGRSNAASAVGRRVSVTIDDNNDKDKNAPALDGLVVAFDPNTNAHTVQFDKDGSTQSLILNCTKFKWIVEATTCSEADPDIILQAGGCGHGRGRERERERLARYHMAMNRGAVHRKLKMFHKGRDKWFHGTVVGFSEESGKHQIKFESFKKQSECNLSERKFQWTDLIGLRHPSGQHVHALSSSRYMGVRRLPDNRWLAFKSGVGKRCYIGRFKSEKDAALAHDIYARKDGRPVNFTAETMSEAEIDVVKINRLAGAPVSAKSKFRGVHWQKNRERWMARYTLSHRGEKNINLGAFVSAKYAALAFDAEARRRGRPDAQLNFPDLHPSDTEIEEWKMNGVHYSMMSSGRKKASQYRGVTVYKGGSFHVQVNINKVLAGLGKEKGPASIGFSIHEKEAALMFDRVCRKYGVDEKELNFPRDGQLKEVRLFDNECYFCCQERPADPVATPCNHIFCRPCISMWLTGRKLCPCCQTPVISEEVLRPVDLVPWPKEKHNLMVAEVAEHRDGSNGKGGSDDGDKGSESTNSSLSESEDDEEIEAAEQEGESIDGQDDEMRDAALRSVESAVSLVSAFSACAKAVNSKKRNVSCAPEQVEGKQRQVDSRNDTDRGVKERRPVNDRGSASRVKEGGSTGDKRRKADAHNDTDRTLEEAGRAGKDQGNASLVKVDSARAKSSNTPGRASAPTFPVGTRFRKEFPGHGTFQGTIMSFDGEHHRVYYSSDGDSEELSDYELDDVEIIGIPTSRARASNKKVNR